MAEKKQTSSEPNTKNQGNKMKNEKGTEAVLENAADTGAPAAPTIIWNDSNVNTSYANVCNVIGTREELTMLFGVNQAWQKGQKEVNVLVSNRIVLNPYAAKRLQRMLDKVLREYESVFGELTI
jgi:hypothetical protein